MVNTTDAAPGWKTLVYAAFMVMIAGRSLPLMVTCTLP